jgi:hypothetical protein
MGFFIGNRVQKRTDGWRVLAIVHEFEKNLKGNCTAKTATNVAHTSTNDSTFLGTRFAHGCRGA